MEHGSQPPRGPKSLEVGSTTKSTTEVTSTTTTTTTSIKSTTETKLIKAGSVKLDAAAETVGKQDKELLMQSV